MRRKAVLRIYARRILDWYWWGRMFSVPRQAILGCLRFTAAVERLFLPLGIACSYFNASDMVQTR
jgi:hypothetical protein